eukprot:SAG22_NODE_1447_length_4404_cov_2.969338_3_plen_257_part_00
MAMQLALLLAVAAAAAWAAAAAVAVASPPPPPLPPNLVANPDFELVDAAGWPRNWSRAGPFQHSTAQHVAGAAASLEYNNENPALYDMVSQHVPAGRVQPGHRYTLSASVKADRLNNSAFGGGSTICATWNAPPPPFYGDYFGGGPVGHTNWTTVSLTFVYPPSAPPLAVAAYVRPLVVGTNRTPVGVVYFGNVLLRPCSAAFRYHFTAIAMFFSSPLPVYIANTEVALRCTVPQSHGQPFVLALFSTSKWPFAAA